MQTSPNQLCMEQLGCGSSVTMFTRCCTKANKPYRAAELTISVAVLDKHYCTTSSFKLLHMHATVWHRGDLQAGESAYSLLARGFLHELHFMIFQGFPAPEQESKIGVYINTKCLLPYSQKFTQTWPLTCIQENRPAPSQPQSPRGYHILTSVRVDHTACVPLARSNCTLSIPSELQLMADVLLAIPTKQVPAKDLQAQPDFPSNNCPRLGTGTEQGGRFPWIATCFAAIKCILWKPRRNDHTFHWQ